jgi:hypothetical protein
MNVLEQAVTMGLWPIAAYLTPYGISANYKKIGLELRRRSGLKLIERASHGLLYMDADDIDMAVKYCGATGASGSATAKRGVTQAVMQERLERDFQKTEAWLAQAEQQFIAKKPQIDQLFGYATAPAPQSQTPKMPPMMQAMMANKGMNMSSQEAASKAFAQMMNMNKGASSSASAAPAAAPEPTKKDEKRAAKKAEKGKKK